MKLNKKGFTLIELLAVIVVTSLVLGLSSYGIINAYSKSKEKVIVLNDKSILEAARIQSSEANSDDWKTLDNKDFFCTTIQRLKNAGLLKKEAKSEEHEDFSLITVERNTSTLNVVDTSFVDDTSTELILLCDIKYFTIHYDYNVSNESGYVPKDQHGEVCNTKICEGISISSTEPKRKGYRFTGWNTESDGSGVLYQSGDNISSNYEETITLYAQWTEDIYTIRYNANIASATGSTSNTRCARDSACTLTQNGYSKSGYEFTGWNTKSNGTGKTYKDNEVVKNITSSTSITLYAQWKPKYKVTIKFNTGGGNITSSTTSSTGVNYRWRKDSNGIISRSVDGGSYIDNFFTIGYGESGNLPNYNNTQYMNITRSGYGVSSGSVWKCTEGECNGTTYNQTSSYNANSFCNASSSDCTVTLTVNWENQNILSPILTASDGILSNEWHCSSYTLSISSENTGSVSYQYKVGTGSYQTYSSPLSPSNGVTTYTARTKSGTKYSGTVSYVSKIDSTAPSAPTITRSINGTTTDVTNKGSNDIPWVNANFSVTLHSTDNESGLAYYQYKYSNTDWVTYANSTDEYFTTTDFSYNLDDYVFFRACNSCGKCSEESKTYIKLDKTKPVVTSIDNPSGGNWTNENVVLTLQGNDSSSNITSGIDHYEYKYSGGNWNTYSNLAMETFEAPAISQEIDRIVYIRVKDKAGNYSNIKETRIKIDKTAPSIPTITNPTNGEWVNYDFALTLSSTDSASGIAYYQYKYSNTDWTTYSKSATEEFDTTDFSKQRNELVYIRACDKAGNCSNSSSSYIKIDKTKPSAPKIERTINGSNVDVTNKSKSEIAWTNQNISLTVTSTDSGTAVSGIDYYQYSYDQSDWRTYQGYAFSAERDDYVYIRVFDKAGNSAVSYTPIRIDKTAPTLSFQMLNGSTAVGSSYYSSTPSDSIQSSTFEPKLRWTANDPLNSTNSSSGVNPSAIYYWNPSESTTLDETLTTNPLDVTGTKSGNNYIFDVSDIYWGYRKFKIRVCDNANNCSEDTEYFKYNTSSGGTYSVTLHRNCPSTYNCHFVNYDNSESITITYTGSRYISSFPELNIGSSVNYAVTGWRVGSASSGNIVTNYIDSAENGKHLYAFWGNINNCKCTNDTECSQWKTGSNNAKCENGICNIYNSSGGFIRNACY